MAEKSADLQALHERQYAFAAHLRDPHNAPAPDDVEARRTAVYSELFFNNVVNFLGGNFPITRKILQDDGWAALVRDFYRDHRSHSPLFPDMPREFLAYLRDERGTPNDDPAFLYEFAHYEWVEAGLLLAPDSAPPSNVAATGDLLTEVPVLREPAWLLTYQFPVNEIGVSFQPTEPNPQPLYYLVLRDAADEVAFNKLNAVSARLFELLQSGAGLSGRAALEQIAAELNHPDPAVVVNSGAQILGAWRDQDIILGTQRA